MTFRRATACFLLLIALALFAVHMPGRATEPRTPFRAAQITFGNGWSAAPSISADGRWIAFVSSASDLVAGDTNGTADIFVYDRLTEKFERVSVASDGTQANAASARPAISANGRFVAFESLADNLAPGDVNAASDIFVHDRLTGVTERVSVNAYGEGGNGWSEQASISEDGIFVAFLSDADNLLPTDTNGVRDAFVHNRLSGYTWRVSIDSRGAQADGASRTATITPSGRTAFFVSDAANLTADPNPGGSLYAFNRILARTLQVPNSAGAAAPDSSYGGQWIAYRLPDDPQTADRVFVYDQHNKTTYAAVFPVPLTRHVLADGDGLIAAVGSPLFGSRFDLYWHDIASGETVTLLEGVSDARPAVSADGGIIAYAQEVNGIPQIGVIDRGLQPQPGYFVSGRVTGPLGDPLALVTVRDGQGRETLTDQTGYFFFAGIHPGQVRLSLSKPGFTFEPGGISLVATSDVSGKSFIYHYTGVLEEARQDIGMPYAHRCDNGGGCAGGFHGYSAGQCTDLVMDAFTWGAECDWTLQLEQDARAHPTHFYQYRNARDAFDMWRYFSYTGQMLTHDQPYQAGDLAFFDWSGDGEIDHVALVSKADPAGRPTQVIEASGVTSNNPGGLAAELDWEPFYDRAARGHARWDGTFETIVVEPPRGEYLQIGLGSAGANLRLLADDGRGLSLLDNSLPGGFDDLIWEKTISVQEPLAGNLEETRYFLVISNPTGNAMPYFLAIQTVRDFHIDNAEKSYGELGPEEIRYLPLQVFRTSQGLPDFELGVSRCRQVSGKISLQE